MSEPSPRELSEFRRQVAHWLIDNRPPEPNFLLPLSFLEVGSQVQLDFLRNWQHKVWQAGYLGMAWPKQYGGSGVSALFQNIVDAEMMRLKTPIIFNAIGLGWAGPLILARGSEAAKQSHIKAILSGEHIWCQGFSEPEHGSDLGSVQTHAVKEGSDYVINGTKIWTTMGNFGTHILLLARTNPNAESRYAGLSFFVAPMNIDGVTTTPIKKLSGEYGFTQTFFDNARIAASTLMGEEGQGWQIALQTLQYERGAEAGSAGGNSITALDVDDVINMLKPLQRDAKSVIDEPLVRDQLVQFKIEERALALSQERSQIAALSSDYPFSIALSDKLARTELARKIRQFAVKLQGAYGANYVDDLSAVDNGYWLRAYFNNFGTTIGGGTSQIQANIIGEHILRLAKG